MNMLNITIELRISEGIKKIIYLIEQDKTSDWYLYQKYTEIGMYWCELPLYKLPRYLPMRVFFLQYIRHMIKSDEINFVDVKKKS